MHAAQSHETLQRHWHMLQLIPTAPAQITVRSLAEELCKNGFKVTERTVQRDLNDLAPIMSLECNNNSKPYGWKFMRGQRNQIPAMSTVDALTFHLVQRHLSNSLPLTMQELLQPLFTQATQTIHALGQQNQLQRWLNCVVVESPSQPLLAPVVCPMIQQAVYEAVYEQKQLDIFYRGHGKNEAKNMILHPLGIIQRGQMTYLGATVNEYEDIRLFALHRFKAASLKPLDNAVPKNKQSWQDYLASGAGGFHDHSKGKITLHAWVSHGLAIRLKETPLSKDQTIQPLDDNAGYSLTASVFDTWQLGWWILSQGKNITIQAPDTLRLSIQDELTAALAGYSFDTPKGT